jgi:hypothetical protein
MTTLVAELQWVDELASQCGSRRLDQGIFSQQCLPKTQHYQQHCHWCGLEVEWCKGFKVTQKTPPTSRKVATAVPHTRISFATSDGTHAHRVGIVYSGNSLDGSSSVVCINLRTAKKSSTNY